MRPGAGTPPAHRTKRPSLALCPRLRLRLRPPRPPVEIDRQPHKHTGANCPQGAVLRETLPKNQPPVGVRRTATEACGSPVAEPREALVRGSCFPFGPRRGGNQSLSTSADIAMPLCSRKLRITLPALLPPL